MCYALGVFNIRESWVFDLSYFCTVNLLFFIFRYTQRQGLMKVLTNEAKDLAVDKAGQLNGETSKPAEHLASVSSVWICFSWVSLADIRAFFYLDSFFFC